MKNENQLDLNIKQTNLADDFKTKSLLIQKKFSLGKNKLL